MINPLKITQGQFDKRWDELPEILRELLYSPEHAEIVQHVCENNHLSEDKTGTVLGIVGGVIMGFVHAQDLDHQISEHLDINTELARSIASDIKERVLKRFENEIEDAFQPSLPSETKGDGEGETQEKIIEISESGSDSENAPISIPIERTEATETPAMGTAPIPNAPFILQEEKKPETAAGGKSIFKGFSIPLGFFKPKNSATRSDDSLRVKVETPIKNEKRTVNYSELRTSLSPFEGGQSFINIDKPGDAGNGTPVPIPVPPVQTKTTVPVAAETQKIPGSAPVMRFNAKENVPIPARPPFPLTDLPAPDNTENIIGMIKKTQPKVDGNVIDLS